MSEQDDAFLPDAGREASEPEAAIERGAVRDRPRPPRAAATRPSDWQEASPAGEDEGRDRRRREAADDAFPETIRRKYYVVEPDAAGQRSGSARVYADPKGEYLAFKDLGDRLTTRVEASEIARDMVAVAAHRGWSSVHVRGSEPFRREAWLAAAARGLQVSGYEPNDLDRSVLAKRGREAVPFAERTRSDAGPGRDSPPRPLGADARAGRPDHDAGVTGRLVSSGVAPYRDEPNGRKTPFLDLEIDGGRRHRIWGADLERALRDASAGIGDRVTVRREAVEIIARGSRDAAGRQSDGPTQPKIARNRWSVTAEAFRTTERRAALEVPELAAAHSHLAILEKAVETRWPGNDRARTIVLDAARERAAEHLEAGRRLRPAELQAKDPDRAAEVEAKQTRQLLRERVGPRRAR